ncbi:MAG TPA: MarR family winged helix-turn-helix transcriptional regulator [Actinomycetospora sp.]|nr:MarR family winged helix-turn-helix transcriptional regulator [Actinomycetospora sp.]
MHIEGARAVNLVGAWVLSVADAVREAAERSTGMGGAGPAALVAVAAEPGMSVETLRRALGLTHPGAVRLVDRLEERGWVERSPGGGRAVALRPTAAGVTARDALLAARHDAIAAQLERLGPDRERLAAVIEPLLLDQAADAGELRRLCRLCDRAACEPCPPWTHLEPDAGDG